MIISPVVLVNFLKKYSLKVYVTIINEWIVWIIIINNLYKYLFRRPNILFFALFICSQNKIQNINIRTKTIRNRNRVSASTGCLGVFADFDFVNVNLNSNNTYL